MAPPHSPSPSARVRPGTLANPALPAAIAIVPALQVAGLYLPFLRDLLHTQPLLAADLLIAGALSCLEYAAVRLDRVVPRDSYPHRRGTGQQRPERHRRAVTPLPDMISAG